MIVGIIQCTILLFISLFWFKVPFAGSFLDFYAAVFFYVLSSTGIGLCVSAISKNMQQVLVYVIVMMVPMALLSGIITPIQNMPVFLQTVTYIDPLRFGLELIRRIYLEGLPLTSLSWNLLPLTVVATCDLDPCELFVPPSYVKGAVQEEPIILHRPFTVGAGDAF